MKNLLTVLFALLILGSCRKEEKKPVIIGVEGVSLPSVASVVLNATQELKAIVSPSDAPDKSLNWTTDNADIVAVDQNGVVTGKALGKAIITATSKANSEKFAKCEVEVVKEKATSITIAPENPIVVKGKTKELKATVLPAEASQSVTWSSGDPAKATIDPATGVVNGVEVGTTLITATATDGSGVKGEVTLTVQSEAEAAVATITAIKLGTEKFVANVPEPGAATTLANAPHTIAADLTKVKVDITATDGAVIKIGDIAYTKDQEVNFTNSVTFSVTEEGKTGGKEYTLTITPYNAGSNPYGIYTADHLHDVRNALSGSFKLMKSITMPALNAGFTGIDDYATAGWLPMGGENPSFTGKLDGGGYMIDNFYIKRTTTYTGLFGKIGSAASIKNLEVKGMEGEGTGDNHFFSVTGEGANINLYTGILAGFNEGRIENCHTSGDVSSGSSGSADLVSTGGLVGYSKGNTISHCYTLGRVDAYAGGNEGNAGGLVGYCEGTITDCYASGNISSYSSTFAISGGLAGKCKGTTISRSYATGVIHAASTSEDTEKDAISGGLVGLCDEKDSGSSTTTIDCFATGNIFSAAPKATSVSGGLTGMAYIGIFTNCYATGNVVSTGKTAVNAFVGILLGLNPPDRKGTITNSYRNSNATATKGGSSASSGDDSLGGTPTSLSDMQKDTFTTALGDPVWGRDDNKNNKLPFIKGVGMGK